MVCSESALQLPPASVQLARAFAIALFCSQAFADDALASPDDSRPAQLESAIKAYGEALHQARSEMIDRLDNEANIAQRGGDLARLEEVIRERKTFQDSKTLPTVISVEFYRRQRAVARRGLIRTYETVIKKLTRDGQVDEATAIQSELIAFKSAKVTSDTVQVDTVWKGEVDQGQGNKYPVMMYVIARDGSSLKLAFSFPTAPALEIAVGKEKDGSLIAKTTEPIGKKAMPNCTYTLQHVGPNQLNGSWSGVAGKKRYGGTIELTKLR